MFRDESHCEDLLEGHPERSSHKVCHRNCVASYFEEGYNPLM